MSSRVDLFFVCQLKAAPIYYLPIHHVAKVIVRKLSCYIFIERNLCQIAYQKHWNIHNESFSNDTSENIVKWQICDEAFTVQAECLYLHQGDPRHWQTWSQQPLQTLDPSHHTVLRGPVGEILAEWFKGSIYSISIHIYLVYQDIMSTPGKSLRYRLVHLYSRWNQQGPHNSIRIKMYLYSLIIKVNQ